MNDSKHSARWPSSAAPWKRAWQLVLNLSACALVAACSTRGTPRTAGVPPEFLQCLQPYPRFDPNLLQLGPDSLPEAKSDDVPTLVRNHAQGAAQYHDLHDVHSGLVDQVKAREAMEAERIERLRQAIDRVR